MGGVDIKTGEGENHLGKILMKVRKEIQERPSVFQTTDFSGNNIPLL